MKCACADPQNGILFPIKERAEVARSTQFTLERLKNEKAVNDNRRLRRFFLLMECWCASGLHKKSICAVLGWTSRALWTTTAAARYDH
jgi:hypothetical protein